MIYEIAKDMRSFVVVLFLIIFGFSLIFKEFNREESYSDHLFDVYLLLYAQMNTADFSLSEKFFLVLVTFILSVMLLNLLIAIMADSFSRVEKRTVLTDSKEKILLIIEALTMKRALFGNRAKKRTESDPQNQGYLFYVVSELRKKDEMNISNFERKMVIIEKSMRGELNSNLHVLKSAIGDISDEKNTKLVELMESRLKNQLQELVEQAFEKEITKQTQELKTGFAHSLTSYKAQLESRLALQNDRLAHLDRKFDDMLSLFSSNKHIFQKMDLSKVRAKKVEDPGDGFENASFVE